MNHPRPLLKSRSEEKPSFEARIPGIDYGVLDQLLGFALRRAQLMSSETRGVKVAATKDGVTITSDNPDLGEVREELEAEYNAEPIAIGFNPKYVVELLGQMSSDQITIALGGELDPGLIRPLTGDDYLGVVMPMRI